MVKSLSESSFPWWSEKELEVGGIKVRSQKLGSYGVVSMKKGKGRRDEAFDEMGNPSRL